MLYGESSEINVILATDEISPYKFLGIGENQNHKVSLK